MANVGVICEILLKFDDYLSKNATKLCGRWKTMRNKTNATDQHICEAVGAYDIVEHWKAVAQFLSKSHYTMVQPVVVRNNGVNLLR